MNTCLNKRAKSSKYNYSCCDSFVISVELKHAGLRISASTQTQMKEKLSISLSWLFL